MSRCFVVFLTSRKDYEPFLDDVVLVLTGWEILVLLATDSAVIKTMARQVSQIARNFFVLRDAYFVCRCLRFFGHNAHSLFN